MRLAKGVGKRVQPHHHRVIRRRRRSWRRNGTTTRLRSLATRNDRRERRTSDLRRSWAVQRKVHRVTLSRCRRDNRRRGLTPRNRTPSSLTQLRTRSPRCRLDLSFRHRSRSLFGRRNGFRHLRSAPLAALLRNQTPVAFRGSSQRPVVEIRRAEARLRMVRASMTLRKNKSDREISYKKARLTVLSHNACFDRSNFR